MKTFGWAEWCAIIALLLGFSEVTARADEGEQAPAVAESAAKSPPLCRCEGDLGPSVAQIRQVLSEPLKSTGLEFMDEPLDNVFNFLQEEYGIPIQIDEPALEDAGLTRDEPLTVNLRNITLQSALRLLLKTKHLTYIIRNEVLIITTPEEAETEFVACVYDVRDLIGRNQGNKNLSTLVDAITSCVARETWARNGKGAAEIKALQPGLLVIAQTQAVHDEIGKLLALIRETVHQPNRDAAVDEMGMMGGRGEGGFGGRGGDGGRGGYGMEGGYGRGGDGGRGGGYGMEGRSGGKGGRGGGGGYGGEAGGRGGDGASEPTPAETDPSSN